MRLIARPCIALVLTTGIALPPSIAFADAPPATTPPPPRLDSQTRRRPNGRPLLIAGSTIAGVGLLSSVIGFSVLGGLYIGNPGAGTSLDAFSPGQARHMLSVARGMEGLAFTGIALFGIGATLAAVGGVRLHNERWRRIGNLRVAPGLGSFTLAGRF